MRLISNIQTALGFSAKVYKDTEWNEYRVKFYIDGQHQQNGDYHTDCKEDAINTAHAQIARYKAVEFKA